MIENQWYVIAQTTEVKSKPVALRRLNKNLVLFRDVNNQLGCIEDKCPHRGVSLATGKIVDGCIECPFHGFMFDKEGKCVRIPANGRDARVPKSMNQVGYKVVEKHGFIYMFNGNPADATDQIPYFEELTDFSYKTAAVHWNTHYSRCIENQLDVVHVPFVHSKTIGRQYKTLVNGPVVVWNENLLTFYVFNEFDQGQKPLKPDEIEDYEKLFSLQFMFPNIWQNRISDKMRIMVAFAPIDEENTMIYLRYCQKFITTPILKDLVNSAANVYNKKVLNEDYQVVKTQLPKKTYFGMKEHLIQGDLPIAEYRRKVKELKESIEQDQSIS